MSKIDFATKCRIIRAAKDWGQKDLAEAVGVDWSTISAWENSPKRRRMADTTEKVEKLFREVQAEIAAQ